MRLGLEAVGSDLEFRGSEAAPTLKIGEMTVGMRAPENYMHQSVVEITGNIGNAGNEWGIMCSMATADNADLSRIAVVPGQRSGQPCIRGLRVTVWDVLDMLATGMTEDEILRDYPYLEKADFPAVYAYAAQAGRERISR
jgi:uncharacterized protein (DUF433 family)